MNTVENPVGFNKLSESDDSGLVNHLTVIPIALESILPTFWVLLGYRNS